MEPMGVDVLLKTENKCEHRGQRVEQCARVVRVAVRLGLGWAHTEVLKLIAVALGLSFNAWC